MRVQSQGERATSRHFVFLAAAGTAPDAPSRIGIVATKKVGDATMRNRIKRVCRECFRQWPDFVPRGIDLVVIAREGAHALPLAQLRDEWSRARPSLLKACTKALTKPPPAPAKPPPAPAKPPPAPARAEPVRKP
ncbi:MAG: ribonuclease P protein component [Labilithrix sp.]|nr:ribonuclease P protein component [Labilithrix sp.]MCW5818131.1 ribonuclease P protein component [Labilithrix sp.]